MSYDSKYKPIEGLIFKREMCAFKTKPKFKCIRYGGGGGGGGGSSSSSSSGGGGGGEK